MTRQEQLDAVVRSYGKWDEGFALVFLKNGRIEFSNDLTTVIYPFFGRQEVEGRKAELQNKPSWGDAPYWAEYLAQDGNTGYWHWYESKPYVRSFDDEFTIRGGIWERCSDGDVIGDWRDTLEKRPEPNSAVDGKWDGEGLPAIGFDYELKPCWHKVKVVAYDKIQDAVRIVYWDYYHSRYDYSTKPDRFRKIQTDREKWVEMVEQKTGVYVARSTIEAIYDAGLAKIPE